MYFPRTVLTDNGIGFELRDNQGHAAASIVLSNAVIESVTPITSIIAGSVHLTAGASDAVKKN
jgi:hypothetical protein